jgi:hypothetical protein
MDESKCPECQADLIWAKAESGSRIALDAQPRSDGKIVNRNGAAVYLSRDLFTEVDEARYVAHAATCPKRASWRRSKPK